MKTGDRRRNSRITFHASRVLFVCLMAAGFLFGEEIMDKASEPTWLDEVVVVASREPGEVLRAPGNVTVITQDDIQRSNATHISEVLRAESGLHITNTSGSSPTGITVEARGFNNGGGNGGRTLVLIDGRRANRADTSSADWATIPLSNVDRIEIIRGPASALYGDSAMAAVINIITRKGEGASTLDLGFDLGSYDFLGQRASAGGTVDKFTYFINSEHSEEDGFRDSSRYRHQDYTAHLTQEVSPEVKLNLKTAYHTHNRKVPGALTDADIALVGRRGSVASNDVQDSDVFDLEFGADYSPTEEDTLSFLFYYIDDSADSVITVPGAFGGTTTLNNDGEDFSLGLRYTTARAIVERENKFTVGFDFLTQDLNTDSSNNFPPFFVQKQKTLYQRALFGFYLNDEFTIHERVILGAGVRYDTSNFDFSQTTNDLVALTTTTVAGNKNLSRWSPKASITFLITEDVSAYFSYSRSFRFPNRDELTGFFGTTPELQPEVGENYEVGLKSRFGRYFSGALSLYRLTVEDEIIAQPPAVGAFAFPSNANFEEVRHQGIEVHAETGILPRSTLFANYTYVDAEIQKGTFDGKQIPITPKQEASIGATVDLGWGFSVWTQGRFVGARYVANDLANAQPKLHGYGLWDAKFSYKYQRDQWKLEAFGGLNNILDRKYDEFGGVGGFPFGSRIGVNPSPEFNFVAGLTVAYTF